MFEGRDANKDGKLSGDEIPEPMRGRLDRIDQNGDGAISRDEVERAAEMMRDRAGGPGAGRRPERDGDEARFALDAPKGMADSLIELFVERDETVYCTGECWRWDSLGFRFNER